MADLTNLENVSLTKWAFRLAWFTIIYNIVEGIVSITWGIQDDSVSLAGFGLDSLIEVGSAFVVLWKLRDETAPSTENNTRREKIATRLIGVLLSLLAIITVGIGVRQLYFHAHPETTLPGAIISTLSLSFMYFLWKAKKKVANQLRSSALKADAYCSLSCIYLSAILFVGSILFMILPTLWWLDSVAAILLALIIGREGIERIKGEECCDEQCHSKN